MYYYSFEIRNNFQFKLDAKKSTEVGKVNVKGEVCPKGADMAPRHSSTQRKSADIYANLEKITKAKYVAEQVNYTKDHPQGAIKKPLNCKTLYLKNLKFENPEIFITPKFFKHKTSLHSKYL